jgi:hypothetical protein
MSNEKDKLELLDEFLLNEILSMPDDEVIAEAGQPDIASTSAAIEAAKKMAGNMRFAEAKAMMEQDRKASHVVSLDRVKARAELASLIGQDKALRGKLTLAARNAAEGQGEDDEGLLDDLAELSNPDRPKHE